MSMSASSYRKYQFGALSLVYLQPFVQGVVMTVAAKDVMREMDLSPDRMGLLGSAYFYAYAPAMLFSGLIAAWIGPRLTMSIMFFASGVGGLLFCLSDTFAAACLGRALTGIGTSVTMTSSLTLFGRWYRGESYSSICAVFFAMGGLGSFFGAGPLAMLNVVWGWRNVFLLIALATLSFAALVFFTVRDWPPPGSERELGLQSTPRAPITLALMRDGVRTMSRSRDFWKLALWFAGMAGVYMSFSGLWAIPYLKDVHSLSDGEAGLAVSMFAFGFIVGNPVMSWLSENKIRSNRLTLCLAALAALASFLPMFLLGRGLGYAWIIASILVLGFSINAPNVVVYSSARNLFGSRMTAVASGAMGGMCFVSGAVMQFVCGSLLAAGERLGWSLSDSYTLAFLPYLPCFLLAFLAALTLSSVCDPGHISPMSWRMILKEKPDAGEPREK